MLEYNEWKIQQTYDVWKSDILEFFKRQIDIWLKYFVSGKIEEIKVFITGGSSIGMEFPRRL